MTNIGRVALACAAMLAVCGAACRQADVAVENETQLSEAASTSISEAASASISEQESASTEPGEPAEPEEVESTSPPPAEEPPVPNPQAPSGNDGNIPSGLDVPQTTDLEQQRAQEAERARALEAYLIETLSPEDYGGIYIWQIDSESEVTMDLWGANQANVDAALAAYPGEAFTAVNQKPAKCTMAQMQAFRAAVERIPLPWEGAMHAIMQERENMVEIYLNDAEAEQLVPEVEKAIRETGIPEECVYYNMWSMDTANPVT